MTGMKDIPSMMKVVHAKNAKKRNERKGEK